MSPASTIIPALLLLALPACAGPAVAPSPTGPIAIAPQTEAALSAYLRKVKVTRPGAFAVSPDGLNSFYSWCDDTICGITNYSGPALRGCQDLAGTPCTVLYVRHEPRLQYRRSDTTAAGRHGSEEQRRIDYDVHGR